MPARIAVLVSGTGTLLQALIDARAEGALDIDIVGVLADRTGTVGIDRARRAGIDTDEIGPGDHGDRAAWDTAVADRLGTWGPDWIVSAGFMRILGPAVLAAFPARIVNTHPALLPAFPGAHGVRDALEYGVTVTGCTVHIVDAGVDTGPILAQRAVPVLPGDDEASLHERIKVVERELLVATVDRLTRQGCRVEGRRAVFDD